MRKSILMLTVLFFVSISAVPILTSQGEETCYYGNTVSELLSGDTYIDNYPLSRDANSLFRTVEPKMKEITTYLNNLNLPIVVKKAHVVLRKALVRYEPYNTSHHGKSWYDNTGNLTDPEGDKNLLKDWNGENYLAVRKLMLDWEIQHHWGPYILYENEEYGKEVMDIEIVLLDKNNCWLGELRKNYYRLPQVNSPINIDNVDAGNEEWQVVLFSRSKDQYISIDGGTSPLYPNREKELRDEWDAINNKEFIYGNANNTSAHHDMKIGGKKIIYNAVFVYPHLTKPKISLVEDPAKKGCFHLIVELPKYFRGRFIPAFIGIEEVKNGKIKVRLIRGSVEQTFFVPISKNPIKKIIDWIRN